MKNRPSLFANLFAIAFLALCTGPRDSWAAPTLQLGEKGILIENGSLKCTLSYPVPVNREKKKGKIQEKTASESGVTLKYEQGGQLEMQLANGEMVLKASAMPEDTAQLYFTMRLSTAAITNGTWQFDAKTGVFPTLAAEGQIFQGHAKKLLLSAASGEGFFIEMPASSFQQMMDLRQFQKKEFHWQCWLPFSAGGQPESVKIGSNSGTIASVTAAASPAAVAPPPVPSKAPTASNTDRQKFGQIMKWEEKKSGTRILKWREGKRAAFLLGFDDNGASHVNAVIPELEKRKMVGNFYINPGNGLWKKHEKLWEAAAKSPYVALHNHTYLHTGAQSVESFEEDVIKTNDIIYGITPHLMKPRIIGFRQPGGVLWKITKEETKGILSKLHMVNRPWLDGPPLSMKSLEEVIKPVETALANGETGFVDFHGVGGDSNSAPTEWFIALLDKLDEHRDQFWIADTVSWFKYQSERKSAEIKVLESDDSKVRVSLTCAADPTYYDLPLSVAVEVPASWKDCKVTQGSQSLQVRAAGGEVRFDALPGADEILITPQS